MKKYQPSRRELLTATGITVGALGGCIDLAQESSEEPGDSPTNSTNLPTGNSTEQQQNDPGATEQTNTTESEDTVDEETEETEDTTESEETEETQRIVERVSSDILAAFSNGEFDRMYSFVYPDSPAESALDEFDEELLAQFSENLDIEFEGFTVQERTDERIIGQAEVRYVESGEEDRFRSDAAEFRLHEEEWLVYDGDFLLPV